MSLNERSFEGDVAEACHHFGVVGLPYGVLSGGTLTGKYITGEATPRSRQNLSPDFQPRYNGPLAVEATREYAKLAEAWGITPTELAIAWARDRWYNAGVIPGFTTVAQVEACVEAFKLEPLPAALNEEVDAIHERYRNPSAAYANKELVQTAPWLEDAMRPKEEL